MATDDGEFALGTIVLYQGHAYAVIGYEYSFDTRSFKYELLPYKKSLLIFPDESELEMA